MLRKSRSQGASCQDTKTSLGWRRKQNDDSAVADAQQSSVRARKMKIIPSRQSLISNNSSDGDLYDSEQSEAGAEAEGKPHVVTSERTFVRRMDQRDSKPPATTVNAVVSAHAVPASSSSAGAQATVVADEPKIIGNVGWFFGNWGQLKEQTTRRDVAATIRSSLKMNPAMIVGLAECGPDLESILQEEGSTPKETDGAEDAQRPKLRNLTFQYLTLRGNERGSLLLGTRANTSERIDCLDWKRVCHGIHKKESGFVTVDCLPAKSSRITIVAALGVITRSWSYMCITYLRTGRWIMKTE